MYLYQTSPTYCVPMAQFIFVNLWISSIRTFMTRVLSCPMWILVTELINISSNNDPVLSSRFRINLFQCSYKGKFRLLICDCILYFFFVYVIVWISFPSIYQPDTNERLWERWNLNSERNSIGLICRHICRTLLW